MLLDYDHSSWHSSSQATELNLYDVACATVPACMRDIYTLALINDIVRALRLRLCSLL